MKRRRKPKMVTPSVPMVRIVRDTRNARLDTFMPKEKAEKLCSEGKLAKLIGIGECFGECYEYIQ